MARKSRRKRDDRRLVQVDRPRRVADFAKPEITPALGWQKLDLWPLSRPKDRNHAANATRPKAEARFIEIKHPDPSTFQRNKPSSLTLQKNDPAPQSDPSTREYNTCKKRPDGNRRSAGKGSGKKFVPWCS